MNEIIIGATLLGLVCFNLGLIVSRLASRRGEIRAVVAETSDSDPRNDGGIPEVIDDE